MLPKALRRLSRMRRRLALCCRPFHRARRSLLLWVLMKSPERNVRRRCSSLDLIIVSRYTCPMALSKSLVMHSSWNRLVVITRINGLIGGHRSSFGVGMQKRLLWMSGMVSCVVLVRGLFANLPNYRSVWPFQTQRKSVTSRGCCLYAIVT